MLSLQVATTCFSPDNTKQNTVSRRGSKREGFENGLVPLVVIVFKFLARVDGQQITACLESAAVFWFEYERSSLENPVLSTSVSTQDSASQNGTLKCLRRERYMASLLVAH
jgi:hypothetical protein